MTKDSAFGSRYYIYRLNGSGFAYNPITKEWEVFILDEDGSIQDLWATWPTKQQAKEQAERLSGQ